MQSGNCYSRKLEIAPSLPVTAKPLDLPHALRLGPAERKKLGTNALAHSLARGYGIADDLLRHELGKLGVPLEDAAIDHDGVDVRGFGCPVWFAKTLSDSDFNRIQGCRPQAKCDSTLGWSTPFGYS